MRNFLKAILIILNIFCYIILLVSIIYIFHYYKRLDGWALLIGCILFIALNHFFINKINLYNYIDKKASEYANNMIDSVRTVTSESGQKTVQVTLKPLEIYTEKKPDIIEFISDKDFKQLLKLYEGNFYGHKVDFDNLLGPYPYEKYDWATLLQIIWVNQNYYKHLKEFQKSNIKKVELICAHKCPCCKKLLNKKIPIEKAVELPMEGCELVRCYGRYCAVVEFDLS